MKTCTGCLFDESVKNIRFDEAGTCNFCHGLDRMKKRSRKADVGKLLSSIKRRMKNRPYDCIVPFSGGIDSAYVLYYVKKAGLRPIAVHTDNGWVSQLSVRNMEKVAGGLGVPLVKITKDWAVLREVYLAFLRASVPDVCNACEVKSISELMDFAARENIPYLLFGFSPETDGIGPLHWHYADGRYFNSVVERFAARKEEALRLNQSLLPKLFYYALVKGIRHIQFPSYVDWDEVKIKKTLKDELQWEDEGHHADCDFHTVANYVRKRKFNADVTKTFLSAQMRAGKLTRDEALAMLRTEPPDDLDAKIEMVVARLGISRQEFEEILALPPRDFLDYRTYYPLIRKMRPLIWFGCKANILPVALYEYMFKTGGKAG